MENKIGKEILQYIDEVCTQFGPRRATSDAETKCGKDLANRLSPYCSTVLEDGFNCYPDLYPTGLIKVLVVVLFLGLSTFLFRLPYGLLAIFLPLLALLNLYFGLIKSKEWLGFLFKKGISHNVIGKIPSKKQCTTEIPAKLKVIISGHIDSAVTMNITRFGDRIPIITLGGIGYGVIAFFLAIVKSILVTVIPEKMILFPNEVITFTVIDIIFLILSVFGIPVIIILYKGYCGNVVVQGANDNLSGVGVALALAKYFSQESNRLENIELWLGGFGAEECGDRGSHAFVKKYGTLGELDNSVAVIPESVGAGPNLGIIKKENMHMVLHNEALAREVLNGYQDYAEEYRKSPDAAKEPLIPCEIIVLKYAGTDGGSFSLNGYNATAIYAYEGKVMKPINWHEVTDTPANCDPKMLELGFQILKHFLIAKDKKV